MINTQKYVVFIITIFFFGIHEGHSIKLSAVRDGAEEILYGTGPITPRLIGQTLQKIDQPEANFLLSPGTRDAKKAISIIKKSKRDLEEKIDSDSESETEDQRGRVKALFNINDPDLDPVPLSYLLEELCSKL